MHGKQRLCNYYEKVDVRYSEIKRGNIMTAITVAKAREETLRFMAIPGMAESIIDGGKTAIENCLEEHEIDW